MKKVSHFLSKVEATIASEALMEKGINAKVVGSRDYSSHVSGSDFGNFELLVDEDRFADAEEILRSSTVNLVEHETLEVNPNSYLKRAILYAVVAMVMVPILANYVSLRNLKLYLDTEQPAGKKISIAILVVLLQIPSALTIYLFTKNYR